MLKKVSYAAGIAVLLACIFAFPSSVSTAEPKRREQMQLITLLKRPGLAEGSRYAIVNQIANNMLSANDYQSAVLFLTDWVQKHPDDAYNSYWLLMTGYAYLSIGAEPFAEYYFDRILRHYPDLLVKGRSVHFLCLKNLIRISKTSSTRIAYFNEMINRFPSEVSVTELYYRPRFGHK